MREYARLLIKYILIAFAILVFFNLLLIELLAIFKIIEWKGIESFYTYFIDSMFLEGCIIFGIGSLLILLGTRKGRDTRIDKNIIVISFFLILGMLLLGVSTILTYII